MSWLAKLQRSVFVDRNRRNEVGDKANEILGRLAAGDRIVLFAEGTSSDGNSVIPFKTSLFAAAKPAGGAPMGAKVSAQTLALTYNKVYGLPLCRRGRHLVAWYGEMDLASHAWRLLGLGPIDAHIRIGPPIPLDQFPDRKALARYAEDKVRNDVTELAEDSERKPRDRKGREPRKREPEPRRPRRQTREKLHRPSQPDRVEHGCRREVPVRQLPDEAGLHHVDQGRMHAPVGGFRIDEIALLQREPAEVVARHGARFVELADEEVGQRLLRLPLRL